MLWRKGWLETRFRLLFTLGFTTFILVLQYSARTAAQPPHANQQPSLWFCSQTRPLC
jgi:hypothetical protein